MRLLVIGNSHLAALKTAWDRDAKYFSGTELIFFGAPGKSLSYITIENGCLVPVSAKTAEYFRYTSGGFDKIDCTGFDGVLFYGRLNIRLLANTLKTHTIAYSQNDMRKHLSTGCLTQIVIDRLKEYNWLSMLREITDIPIFFSPSPYPSRNCLDVENSEWDFLNMNNDSLEIARNSFVNGAKLALREFKTTFLPQPEETIEDILFTQTRFSKESVGLFGLSQGFSVSHEDNDVTHMNIEYGKIILSQILSRISSEVRKD